MNPIKPISQVTAILSRISLIKYTNIFLLAVIFTTFIYRKDIFSFDEEADIIMKDPNLKSSRSIDKSVYYYTVNKSQQLIEKDIEIKMKYRNPVPPWDREGSDYFNFRKRRFAKLVKCSKIIKGSEYEIAKARELGKYNLKGKSLFYYFNTKNDCQTFLTDGLYITEYLSHKERYFPIAYSIVIHKSVYQFERLLRAIYRPQNYYCIHVDSKMTDAEFFAVKSILGCFDNVFLSSASTYVGWGAFSVLATDIVCITDLLKYQNWKYFINLNEKEFPLKTNKEIVDILTAYDGANDVHITLNNRQEWEKRWSNSGPPPFRITPYKGSVHVAINRKFAEYAVSNTVSNDFLEWINKTLFPEETYFTTLNHNPQLGIPGTFDGMLEMKNNITKGDMARYKVWATNNGKCGGKYDYGLCVMGVADLPSLVKRPEMFVSQLNWDFEHYALDCLEEYIYNRTIDGYYGNVEFDTKQYFSLYFVKMAVGRLYNRNPRIIQPFKKT